MKVSVCVISWNRLDPFLKSLHHNLTNHGFYGQIEVLVADQGSTEGNIAHIEQVTKPNYFRKNSKNEGVSSTWNQLILRSTGDIICLLGNDIMLPQNWLQQAIDYSHVINCGIIGYKCTEAIPPLSVKPGHKCPVEAHFVNMDKEIISVFGSWVVPRAVFDKVGCFDEKFNPYGLEDSDFNIRTNMAGFNSFYLPNMKSEHLCNDVGRSDAYRKIKDNALKTSLAHYGYKREQVYPKGEYYIPFPEKKPSA